MEEMEIVRRLTHLFYLFRRSSMRTKDDFEMNSRDFMMLDMINKKGSENGLVKMNEISNYFHVTPAAVTQIVRNFENKGWVERVRLDNDRRSVYIKVSKKALVDIKNREANMLNKLVDFIEILSKEDQEALVRILENAVVYTQKGKEQI